jgi:hypothetical protein|tara:strand:+ start:11798 stop:12028 length:231 start_codon:yes stop_codon:yes gene_type:complete
MAQQKIEFPKEGQVMSPLQKARKSKAAAIKPVIVKSMGKFSGAGRGMGRMLVGGAVAAGVVAGVGILANRRKKKEK